MSHSTLARAVRSAPGTGVEPRQTPGRPRSRAPRAGAGAQPWRLKPAPAALVALLVAISVVGAPYYAAPVAERVRHPLHGWLRPSGYVGQTAGLLALGIFLVLWLYPLRKKLRALAWAGRIARWLEVHVQLALALPLLVAVHAGWRFTGVIGLGFWAMMVVWLSGIVGRYLYTRIPRSRAGVELTREEIAAERTALLAEVAAQTRLDLRVIEGVLAADPTPAARLGLGAAFRRLVADDVARRRATRRLRQLTRSAGVQPDRAAITRALRLARREMALAQQARMLDATHELVRYWHVAHRPVAIGALVAVLVHVAVVVAVGATWLW
ncbi:MAG TPA: hypothetical protein VFU46_10895 [Gemmatimonadales bacterium]|nr:hypothetical protein [Gemmatimonadales bacterium]